MHYIAALVFALVCMVGPDELRQVRRELKEFFDKP